MLHIASFVVAVNQPRLTRPGTGKQALPSSLLDFAKPIQDVVTEIYQLHDCVADGVKTGGLLARPSGIDLCITASDLLM